MGVDSPPWRRSRLEPLLRPVNAFLSAESAGGVLLLVAAVVALGWANSPWGKGYHAFWHREVEVRVGWWGLGMSLEHWVNDGLMVVFFLLAGLEIKRELLFGELASVRRASLPVAAAVGGMVVPAGIYALINARGAGAAGWGVPMATDIAFAVGVMGLVARGAPPSVKVFLLAVAIVDDLGAVVVIALFYTHGVSAGALGVAGAFLVVLVALNVLGVHRPWLYAVVGVGLWLATLCSGVHATVAGVLLALTIPATREVEEGPFVAYARRMLGKFERDVSEVPDEITERQSHALKALEEAAQAVQTPLARVEHALLLPVNFLIVPLFALANAGVELGVGGRGEAGGAGVMWGVVLGLVVGKPVGILLSSWGAVRVGVAQLPEGAGWRQVAGVAVLCGIGFTMSLFVANLAFGGNEGLLSAAKVGILLASLIAGVGGGVAIRLFGVRRGSESAGVL